jgi:hypothetical protein
MKRFEVIDTTMAWNDAYVFGILNWIDAASGGCKDSFASEVCAFIRGNLNWILFLDASWPGEPGRTVYGVGPPHWAPALRWECIPC